MSDAPATMIEVRHDGDDAPAAIAVRAEKGDPAHCGIMWLGGFKSDMEGGKATALAQWARAQGRGVLRLDYSGHGESGGDFSDGTIGRWVREARAVFDSFAQGPVILVGSSMGGWIAQLLTLALAGGNGARVAGLVLIAPATDFTEELMWAGFSDEVREEIMRTGAYLRPSEYDEEPYEITRTLIEEGRQHLLLGGAIALGCPVRILQGMKDEDVPWQHALRTLEAIADEDVTMTLVKDGDHRLSRDQDIARLIRLVEGFCEELDAQ